MSDLDNFGTASFDEWLLEELRDPEFAREYLNAALEDEDPRMFLLALRYLAKAHGGMAQLAEEAELSRETLYRTLSLKGNPTLSTLTAILDVFGWQLALEPKSKERAA